ncbi:MAG: hypothetical protein GY816_05260 [Cytophagales bacterium]|nr:hypothetical protein [Cytophagales bacterium]
MDKFVCSFLLLFSIICNAQVQMQAGFGFQIGINGHPNFVTIENEMDLRILNPNGGEDYWFLAASHKFRERFSVRVGLEMYKNWTSILVYEPSRMEIGYLIRNWGASTQVNLPIDFQFQVRKGIYVNGGIMASRMLKSKYSGLEVNQEIASLYWSNEDIDLISEAIDVYRNCQVSYRYGLTLRPFKHIGAELLYSAPFTNLIKSPIKYKGTKNEVDFRYRTTTVKLVYYFDLGKKKDEVANADQIRP